MVKKFNQSIGAFAAALILRHGAPAEWLVWIMMRNALINGIFSLENLAIGFIIALIYLAITYWFLIYNYRLAIKNGLIARISAESF